MPATPWTRPSADAHVPPMCPTALHASFYCRSVPHKGGEPACRPGSVPRLRGAAVIHLGLPLPAASCGLPASIGRAALDRSRREPLVPLLTLLRVGFTEPPQSPAALVVSYTAVSPLPRVPDARRSVFCGTVPRVTPGRRYRPPCPVEPGPSSPGLRPARPPGRLTRPQDTPNATWPAWLTEPAPANDASESIAAGSEGSGGTTAPAGGAVAARTGRRQAPQAGRGADSRVTGDAVGVTVMWVWLSVSCPGPGGRR